MPDKMSMLKDRKDCSGEMERREQLGVDRVKARTQLVILRVESILRDTVLYVPQVTSSEIEARLGEPLFRASSDGII